MALSDWDEFPIRRVNLRPLIAAVGFALLLHLLFLLVPVREPMTTPWTTERTVTLEWTDPVAPATQSSELPESFEEVLPVTEPPEAPVATEPESTPVQPSAPLIPPSEQIIPKPEVVTVRPAPQDELDRERLLTRLRNAPMESDPVISIFGPGQPAPEAVEEFQFPEREGLLTMLDTPLPDLPFEDPGLDVFMYRPDALGTLHRGFDTLTPEFGFTTKTGFTVRCRFILIAAGCGWGRKHVAGATRDIKRPGE